MKLRGSLLQSTGTGLGSELIKTTCTLSAWVFLIYRKPESHYSLAPVQFSLPNPTVFIGINKKEKLVKDMQSAQV